MLHFSAQELMVIAGVIFVFLIGMIGSAVSASQWSHDKQYAIAPSVTAAAVCLLIQSEYTVFPRILPVGTIIFRPH